MLFDVLGLWGVNAHTHTHSTHVLFSLALIWGVLLSQNMWTYSHSHTLAHTQTHTHTHTHTLPTSCILTHRVCLGPWSGCTAAACRWNHMNTPNAHTHTLIPCALFSCPNLGCAAGLEMGAPLQCADAPTHTQNAHTHTDPVCSFLPSSHTGLAAGLGVGAPLQRADAPHAN
jgi:hypothetical protein